MRVLIADDQPSVRFALKLALKQQDIDVAGDVSDSGELLAWLKTNQTDLLLLDWELPDLPGKKIIPILRARYPRLTVIVLNSRPETRTKAWFRAFDDISGPFRSLRTGWRPLFCSSPT
jgi:DNA-binding NarL/FixJ family response regulator